MKQFDSAIVTGQVVFLGLLTLVPAGLGFVAARIGGIGGWVLFGVCAIPLAFFALFGESMRQSTNSTGIDAYWHFMPIACLILGRIAGAYLR